MAKYTVELTDGDLDFLRELIELARDILLDAEPVDDED